VPRLPRSLARATAWLPTAVPAAVPIVAAAAVVAAVAGAARLPGRVPLAYAGGAQLAALGAGAQCGQATDSLPLPTPPTLPRELRGAWISPVDRGEWPSRPGMTEAEQRAELVARFDQAAWLGLNAVVLHVRPAADALYPTAHAPWSAYLTAGTRSSDVRWDPLAVAVEEAHRRGLQLHVWFNPFRASSPDGVSRVGADRIAAQRPEWLVRYGSQWWIDPGIPEARQAVLDAVFEVVDRYDVDAIHLDDYFYPYRIERAVTRTVKVGRKRRRVTSTVTLPFEDDRSWGRYGRGAGWDTRADWRRANVNAFMEALYKGVKERKPTVLVGVSPFGIWRPGSPSGITGLDAYGEIYADSRRWLREGWVDYLAPQLYWQLEGAQHRFTRLDGWWRSENRHRRHVWPGLLTMRTASINDPWPADEVPAQIDFLRRARQGTDESMGHVHFRLGKIPTTGSLAARLVAGPYAEPALPPESPWLGAARPAAPTVDACAAGAAPAPGPDRRTGLTAAVAPGDTTPVRWWLVQLQSADGRWTSRLHPATLGAVPVVAPGGGAAVHAAVSAVSPTGVASEPRVVALPTTAP
jgi:uncharacterized lipoprotein YddW (UPF0748 family)